MSVDHKKLAAILGSEPVDLRTENAELRKEVDELRELQERDEWRKKIEQKLDELYLRVVPDGDTSAGHAIDRITVVAARWRKLRAEIERLRDEIDCLPIEQNERLRSMLVGAWVSYDSLPYQMGTPEYDRLQRGNIYGPSVRVMAMYQLDAEALDAIVNSCSSKTGGKVTCSDCSAECVMVRPGKWQCPNCE